MAIICPDVGCGAIQTQIYRKPCLAQTLMKAGNFVGKMRFEKENDI